MQDNKKKQSSIATGAAAVAVTAIVALASVFIVAIENDFGCLEAEYGEVNRVRIEKTCSLPPSEQNMNRS